MSFEIKITPKFEKELKRLSKKYPSLKTEYPELVQSLRENPIQGTSLGDNCYKVRIPIASKGKGKSGGARTITYLKIKDTTVFLLTIYDKGEKETTSSKEIEDLLKLIDD